MSSQQNVDNTTTIRTEQFLDKMTNSAAYITVAIGYLLAILAANSLTVVYFVAFTAFQVSYCVILWLLMKCDETNTELRTLYLLLGALSVLAVTSGLLSAGGIYWDWLLYLASGDRSSRLPARTR